jgi:DNA processing protein
MEAEKYYQVALTRVPSIGYVHAKILLEQFGSAKAIFEASLRSLQSIEGIGQQRARHIRNFSGFSDCEQLVQQSEAKGIRLIGYNDPDYPRSLKDCYDPPSLLFYAGTGSLNLPRTVAIIGTRNHSEYGRQLTQQLVKELAAHNICIISGMAYGIDGLAHRTALENGCITIGVLAHGLDHIYPSAHTGMAKEMLKHGGALLTEFPIGTKAQRHHFPIRNRIVAGISKAVIIIETGVRGGSVITAGMANSYNIPVFAIPGRLTDKSSAGCNQLVRDQKAMLFTRVSDFLDEMQWKDTSGTAGRTVQLDLLPELDPSSTLLVHLLGKHGILPLDQLYILSGLESGTAAKAILDLELGGIIKLLPGKRYALA